MDTVHNLWWWTMCIDGQLAQSIAAGNGHRWTRFPIYCGGRCLWIDGVPSLLLPQLDHCYQVSKYIVADNIYR